MRSKITGLSVACLCVICASAANAKIITCAYTEPFITIVYNSINKTVKIYKEAQTKPDKTIKVSVRAAGSGNIELFNKTHGLRQTMKLDHKGSDGMSDKTYPYTGTLIHNDVAARLIGGCIHR